MSWTHYRHLLVPTCLLAAATLSACGDVLTGPDRTVDLSEWGSCLLCGGPGPHPGIQTPTDAPDSTELPSTDASAITVEVRADAR